ncbi:hypothetical protein H8959_010578 [Pygathrix nigripes]
MEEIYAKFVSQKISKTRWRPLPPGSLQTAETFATGSWDNEVPRTLSQARLLHSSEPVMVCLSLIPRYVLNSPYYLSEKFWSKLSGRKHNFYFPRVDVYVISKTQLFVLQENYVSLWSIGDFGNLDSDGGFEGDHQLLCDIRHHGDVMDLQFFDQERIVTASSTGCVTVFLHHPNNQTLSVNQQWTTAHYHAGPGSPSYSSAPCTGVVCNNPEIVTVGEDDNADSSTLHAVTFLRTPEILTVNSIGQLKIWDFRQQGNEPSQILSLTGDRVPLHCVDRHPNQQHVVATGGQDGMLSIWDVRQGTMPVSLLKAHEAENLRLEGMRWRIMEDGGRSSTFLSHSISNQANVHQSVISSWLSTDPAKDRIEITSLLPSRSLSVNSLDILGPCLVCGTDAEAIYVTRHLFS